MGEYAKRTSDGQKVKIGTCEMMYYLRIDQRHQVTKIPNSLDPETQTGLFWRLPFPDEDGIRPGDFNDYNKGYLLNGYTPDGDTETGIMQVSKFALLINMPCYHGTKLPDMPAGWRVFWNGKESFLQLAHIKEQKAGELWPVISCRACGKMWRCYWEDVLPHVHDAELKRRLEVYAKTLVKPETEK